VYITAAGGLTLFLWAIHNLSDTLENSATKRTRQFISKATISPWIGFLSGIFVTAILQSSSLTTVMLISLVKAKIVNLRQSLGVIIGANLGTTITAQLLSFNLHQFALPLFTFGFILQLLSNPKLNQTGKIIIYFSLLLLGFYYMVNSLGQLTELSFFLIS